MSASKSQVVEVQITSGRWSLAVVVKIISGDTVNLVALADGVDPWPTPDAFNGVVAGTLTSVTKGTGVGQWREIALPSATTAAIAAAVADALTDYSTDDDIATAVSAALATVSSNLASAVSTAASNLASSVTTINADVAEIAASLAALAAVVEAIPVDDDSGLTAVAAAGSAHSGLGLNAVRQPSSTRPTRVTAAGSMTLTSTLLGAQTASVDLLSDSSNPPTTRRGRQPAGVSGVAATVTMPWALSYDVPAGHYYKLVPAASANASVALDDITETAG